MHDLPNEAHAGGPFRDDDHDTPRDHHLFSPTTNSPRGWESMGAGPRLRRSAANFQILCVMHMQL
eukprot:9260251-Pyramimonas_sp.AAC.1